MHLVRLDRLAPLFFFGRFSGFGEGDAEITDFRVAWVLRNVELKHRTLARGRRDMRARASRQRQTVVSAFTPDRRGRVGPSQRRPADVACLPYKESSTPSEAEPVGSERGIDVR